MMGTFAVAGLYAALFFTIGEPASVWPAAAARVLVLASVAWAFDRSLRAAGKSWEGAGLRPPSLLDLAWAAGGAAAAYAVPEWLIGARTANVGDARLIAALDPGSWRDRLGLLAKSAVLAPLVEELVYRGAFMGLSGRPLAGALAGSVAFSAAHALALPRDYAAYLLLGLVFAGVYGGSGSLTSAVLAHALVNAVRVLRG